MKNIAKKIILKSAYVRRHRALAIRNKNIETRIITVIAKLAYPILLQAFTAMRT